MIDYTPFYIYRITCLPTKQIYIGQTINAERRKQQHFLALARGRHHSALLQQAYNTHGKGNFRFEVIETDLTCRAAAERERYLIEQNEGMSLNMKQGGINSVIAGLVRDEIRSEHYRNLIPFPVGTRTFQRELYFRIRAIETHLDDWSPLQTIDDSTMAVLTPLLERIRELEIVAMQPKSPQAQLVSCRNRPKRRLGRDPMIRWIAANVGMTYEQVARCLNLITEIALHHRT